MRKVKVWTPDDTVVDLLPESSGKLLPCPGGGGWQHWYPGGCK